MWGAMLVGLAPGRIAAANWIVATVLAGASDLAWRKRAYSGCMTILPLISPEKGTQLGWIAQGTLLVVSGVYYPVDVLPTWMQWLATISPANSTT